PSRPSRTRRRWWRRSARIASRPRPCSTGCRRKPSSRDGIPGWPGARIDRITRMLGTSQGFGEHGAFTVSVSADPRLGETVHEVTRKAAEMTGCSAASAVVRAVGDVDLAYRPLLSALVVEIRAGRTGNGVSLHQALGRDVFQRV